MYHQHSRDLENKQVCSYLIGKIDNNLIGKIEIEDYQMCSSRGGTNGALIINFNIKSGDRENDVKSTVTPFKR